MFHTCGCRQITNRQPVVLYGRIRTFKDQLRYWNAILRSTHRLLFRHKLYDLNWNVLRCIRNQIEQILHNLLSFWNPLVQFLRSPKVFLYSIDFCLFVSFRIMPALELSKQKQYAQIMQNSTGATTKCTPKTSNFQVSFSLFQFFSHEYSKSATTTTSTIS